MIALLTYSASGLVFHDSGKFFMAIKLSLAIAFSIMSLFPLLKIFKIDEGAELLRAMATLIGKFR